MKVIFAAILVLAFPAFIVYSCIPLSLEEIGEWFVREGVLDSET